jgi:hypothetical protein
VTLLLERRHRQHELLAGWQVLVVNALLCSLEISFLH